MKKIFFILSIVFLIIQTSNSQTFKLGQKYGGGIIFYLDSTGKHGLIASIKDQGKTLGKMNLERAKRNTKKPNILNEVSTQDYDDAKHAERMCSYYFVTVGNVTYSDWYLPSKYELSLLYEQKNLIGGFMNDFYWSSSMNDYGLLWLMNFADISNLRTARNCIGYVRAIRAF